MSSTDNFSPPLAGGARGGGQSDVVSCSLVPPPPYLPRQGGGSIVEAFASCAIRCPLRGGVLRLHPLCGWRFTGFSGSFGIAGSTKIHSPRSSISNEVPLFWQTLFPRKGGLLLDREIHSPRTRTAIKMPPLSFDLSSLFHAGRR
jgi:hypothetical protein